MTFKINFIKEVKKGAGAFSLPSSQGGVALLLFGCALGALKDVPPAPGGAGVLYL